MTGGCNRHDYCAKIAHMDTIDLLRADVQRLRTQRDEVVAELTKLESALEVLARYEGKVEAQRRAALAEDNKPAPKIREVMECVTTVLREKSPLHTADLYKAVIAAGVEIGGNDPEQYMSAMLSRSKDSYGLQVDRRYGWSLKPKEESEKGEGFDATNTEALDLQPAS